MMARQGMENAQLATRGVDQYCAPDEKGGALLGQAIRSLGLSARGYHRILKVARTVADIAGDMRIGAPHVAEAIQYRRLDRHSR
jgi:magnesium chelatase family protein